ncbi:hypothetical protein HC752_24265 [Vibrio sp. S9_S30]|uniref:immunity protein Imm33 domain-containing protein n=1 Tax=Vibrio sp. S9_S30 TaxID=2720226 RepID=UPI0016819D00|nr:hypothetical protein [Vibrio sp. S9_S30]MBD1560031.1 hypothetical protein [Vibrio sp. S9_S30]
MYSQENGISPQVPEALSKLGIALPTIGQQPINGLRHPPENGTNGWYIWCGQELLVEDDFFSPLHIEHTDEYLPQIKKYLDLPPGYRFLIDCSGYEDVWYDPSLLSLDT